MKTALIKISGKQLSSFENKGYVTSLMKKLSEIYDGIVIVHGAGKAISEWSSALGVVPEFIEGQRVTDKEVIKVVSAVQNGIINSSLVANFNSAGFIATGVSGLSYGSFEAEIVNPDLGYVGIPKLTGSLDWVQKLLSQNIIPVFSSLCMNSEGELINVNADIFAGILGKELGVNTIYFVSDIEGVKIDDEIADVLCEEDVITGIAEGHITEGMIPKLQNTVNLLEEGIDKIWIGNELLDYFNSDMQLGTHLVKDQENKNLHKVA